MKSLINVALAGAVFISTVTTAVAYQGQELAKHAAVTLEQARKTALRTVPGGRITGQELERERGGSGLRYSFDVRTGAKTHEVGIDAKTGRVLENIVEGKNPD